MGCGPHVEVLHRLGDIELVHGGDDDGRGGEEEEEDEEDDVDDQAAQPPDEASDGEVLPGEARGGHSRDRMPVVPGDAQDLPLLPPTHWSPPRLHEACPATPLCSPVDILGVRSIGHSPVGDMQGLAAGRGAGLPTAGAALTLTHVEILQDAGGMGTSYCSTSHWGPHC